jgi:hypothetical protein
VDNLLADQERLRLLGRKVANTKADAFSKKDYKYRVEVTKIRTIPTSNNVTVCFNCKFNCHDNCIYINGADKKSCCAMTEENCTYCPKKCSWKFHENSN